MKGVVTDALEKAWFTDEVSGPGEEVDVALKEIWEKRKKMQGIGTKGQAWGLCRKLWKSDAVSFDFDELIYS